MPKYHGEVPNEDVHEASSNQGPPTTSAPTLSEMDRVSGYENVNFGGGVCVCTAVCVWSAFEPACVLSI